MPMDTEFEVPITARKLAEERVAASVFALMLRHAYNSLASATFAGCDGTIKASP